MPGREQALLPGGLPSHCLKELGPFALPPESAIGAGNSFTPYLFLSQRAPQDADIIPIALAGEIPPRPVDEPNLHEGEQSGNGRFPTSTPGSPLVQALVCGPRRALRWRIPAFQG